MAEQTADQNVKVEDLGPTKKRLTITVPADVVDEKIQTSLHTLAAETSLPGFRKGRAPASLLEKRFGSALRGETKNQVIAEAYSEAIEAQSIRTAGEPQPAEGFDFEALELEKGTPLTFAIEVEVIPDFELPDLSAMQIKRPTLEIGDDMVEAELERQRYRNGTGHAIEGEFVAGDRLAGRAEVTKVGEDEPFFTHDAILVVHPDPEEEDGRGQVLGLMIDGLAAEFAGKKVGDTVKIETKGPEQHEREDIRGADIVIEYTINQAERIEPTTVEHLVEVYGMGTEEVLREQIRLALERRRDQEIADAMRTQVADQLLEAVDFPLPEKLSQSQVERGLARTRMELLYRGVSEDEVEDRLAELREESAEDALRRLKLFLVYQRLAEEYGVEVNEHEINGRIAEMAAQRGERPEKLRQQLAESNQLTTVAIQIREHKTADRVVEEATVTDISADDWREIVDARRAEAAAKRTS